MNAGINYPWSSFQGLSNYGCDFGLNVWGSHTGVSRHVNEVESDFDAMAGQGSRVVRWFVFTDGRGGIRFADGWPAALADGFFDDMDAALSIATARDVQLCLVLFDHLWMNAGRLDGSTYAARPETLAAPEGQDRLFETIIDPFLERYGKSAALHSIDVINEPDWVTDGLELHRHWWQALQGSARPFSMRKLRALVAGVAARVHAQSRALVTVGGARVRHVAEWDDPAYGLDVIQVHSYPDVRHPNRDRSLLGSRCVDLGVSRPVLIGEFPANGDRQHPPGHHPPPFSAEDYFALAHDGGYLAAWPWSFKGHDAFGGFMRPVI